MTNPRLLASLLSSASYLLFRTLPVGRRKFSRLSLTQPVGSTKLYDHGRPGLFIRALFTRRVTAMWTTSPLVGVKDHTRSNYGNPVHATPSNFRCSIGGITPMFNDPEQDGVNGNELVYQENIEFDIAPYKPFVFNGQPCEIPPSFEYCSTSSSSVAASHSCCMPGRLIA